MAKGRLPMKSLVIPCGLFLQGLFLSAGSSLCASASSLLFSASPFASSTTSSSSSSGVSSCFFCFFDSFSSSDDAVSLRFFDFFSFFCFFSFFDFFFFSVGSSSADLRSDFDSFNSPSELNETRSSFSSCFTASLNCFLDALSSSVSTDDRSFFRFIDLPLSDALRASMMEDTRPVDEVILDAPSKDWQLAANYGLSILVV
mmetsp:Transcript_37046/g.75541  ORF Transcript_37046/g.75541 Transcript_37046/m.75541 type:complete len:201 (+) Transcript_37046:2715-3317(+)